MCVWGRRGQICWRLIATDVPLIEVKEARTQRGFWSPRRTRDRRGDKTARSAPERVARIKPWPKPALTGCPSLTLRAPADHLAPQRTGRSFEGEGNWFRRALTEAGKVVKLTAHAPKGAPDPVEAGLTSFTSQRGTCFFTLSPTRAYLLPHSSPERRAVQETTRRAVYFYLALAEQVIHLRRPSSGIFAGFGGCRSKV